MSKNVDILIGGNEDGTGGITLHRGTGFKDNPDISDDSTPCFDEVVTQGDDNIGGTIEIEKLAFDSMDEYVELRDKLKDMLKNPTLISVFELVKFKGEPSYVIQKNYKDCVVSGNDYEMKPAEKSVRSLKFRYASMEEKDPVLRDSLE